MQSKHAVDASRAEIGQDDQKAIEQLLDQHGYVYLESPANDFDYVAFLQRLGPLYPQYGGEIVCSIKPDPQYDGMYSSLNTKELTPHTEYAEFTGLPPRYIALWCLVPVAGEGGQTMLGDVFAFLDTVAPHERAELAARQYEFVSTPGLQSMRLGSAAMHPVLEVRGDLPAVARFSYTCMECRDDPFILGVRERLHEFVTQNRIAVDYTAGSLLIWDNYRMVHWRTAFEDRRRHLRRVWIGER